MKKVFIVTVLCLNTYWPTWATDRIHERVAAVAAHTQLTLPKSGSRHPLAVLLPGCLSWHPHHDKWQDDLLARGFAVLHIDSFAARGFEGRGALESQVCTGRRVRGDERAGDLMATLNSVWSRTDIQADKTILMGWSHGGWTAMDFMSLTETDSLPPNLSELPALDIENLRAAFLFYPYCGLGSLTGGKGFPDNIKTLIFHGSADIITNPKQCLNRAETLAAAGADIEFISLRGARHWFDNHDEPMTFSPDASARATAMIHAVLQEIASD